MAQLCDYCDKIPFTCLAMPTADEIRKARAAVKAGRRRPIRLPYRDVIVQDDTADQANALIDLGMLGRIRESSYECELCRLMIGAIDRQGAKFVNNLPIPEDDDNVHIVAGMPHYGTIWESITGNRQHLYFTIQRLQLTVVFVNDTDILGTTIPGGNILALYSSIAQAVNLDEDFEVPTSSQSTLLGSKVEPVDDENRMLFCARKRADMIDFDLIRSWINLCQSEHDDICHISSQRANCASQYEPSSEPRKCVRFIDVDRGCLATFHNVELTKIRYAALSYVWGITSHVVKLTHQHVESFHQPEEFSCLKLSKTIMDSIEVAKRLDIKYLWVDALCILQDGAEESIRDRRYQLESMGTIYSSAFITIVAACGDGSDDGLNGLYPGSRTFQQQVVEVIPGKLGLVATCTSRPVWTQNSHRMSAELRREDVDASTWSTRAWTYQERSLSRRCLIFTREQVFWACDGGIFCEESHFEHPDILKDLPRDEDDGPLRLDLADQTGGRGALAFKTINGILAKRSTTGRQLWQRYGRDVETYSSRNLSFLSDIHDAFRSALEAYTSLSGETFLWGHPKSQIGLSLLWQPTRNSTLYRRTMESYMGMDKSATFPSWSWMGWIGSVELSLGEEKLESVEPSILCFTHRSLSSDGPPRISMVYGINLIDSPDGATLDIQTEDGPYENPYFPRTSWCNNETLDVTWIDIQQNLPALTEARIRDVTDEHILFFWASSASFEVAGGIKSDAQNEEIYNNNLRSSQRADIKDHHGDLIGQMERIAHSEQAESVLSGRQEFIALGRQDIGIEELRSEFPPKIVAMQIHWEDDLAYRINIAEIDQEAWEAAQPVWRLIALK